MDLHRFWDGVITSSSNLIRLRNEATALRNRQEFQRGQLTELGNTDIESWAKESFEIASALRVKYGHTDGSMKRLLMITIFLGVLMVLVQESRAQKDLSCNDWLGLNQPIKTFYLTAFRDGAAVSSAEIAYREKRDLIKAGWPDDLEVGLVLVMVHEFCKRPDNQNKWLLEAMVYIVNRTNKP